MSSSGPDTTQDMFKIAQNFYLRYDPTVPCLIMVWRGYHPSAVFRARNAEVLGALARHRATKLLCDIRYFLLIAAADQDWLNNDWLPRAMEAGLRQCAIVSPIYFFNRVAVQTVVDRIASALQVEYFDSPEAGLNWLRGK